ncbi:MAG: hypothetical protein H7268_05735 [Sandarakinorhabdus sp.]|nr:hypothetical protein [Sandarakinorhabdus sp.]
MFDPVQPFVLFDDAAAGTARLFPRLVAQVSATTPGEVAAALARLRGPGPWAVTQPEPFSDCADCYNRFRHAVLQTKGSYVGSKR